MCQKCEISIHDEYNRATRDYTVCDSCEATICVNCIAEQNECPICSGVLTEEDNF
jgi:hypothetical protein